jgi:outer membrane immunogenic protein
MTKKLLLSSVALVSLISYSALAAPPTYDWSGFYIGANAGGGWGSVKSNYEVVDTLLLNDPSAAGTEHMSGIVGGVQAGYNWQVGNWVYGLATDFQLSSLASEAIVGVPITVVLDPVLGTVTDDHSVKLPWFGTARGSIGFTPANDWLVYATGGLAYGGIDENNTVTSPLLAAGSHDLTRAGWTVGGGIAMGLSPRWSAQLQYLYLDFGSFADTAVSSDGFTTATINSRLTDNVITVGLNYSFAPVPPPSPPILRK